MAAESGRRPACPAGLAFPAARSARDLRPASPPLPLLLLAPRCPSCRRSRSIRQSASAPFDGRRRRGGARDTVGEPPRGDQEPGVADHPVLGPHGEPVDMPAALQRLPGGRLGEVALLPQRARRSGPAASSWLRSSTPGRRESASPPPPRTCSHGASMSSTTRSASGRCRPASQVADDQPPGRMRAAEVPLDIGRGDLREVRPALERDQAPGLAYRAQQPARQRARARPRPRPPARRGRCRPARRSARRPSGTRPRRRAASTPRSRRATAAARCRPCRRRTSPRCPQAGRSGRRARARRGGCGTTCPAVSTSRCCRPFGSVS